MKPRLPSPRAQSSALLAPLVGAFLLLPPFVTLFVRPWWPFGVPLIVLYLFGVWAVLIAISFWIGRHLDSDENPAVDAVSDPLQPPPPSS